MAGKHIEAVSVALRMVGVVTIILLIMFVLSENGIYKIGGPFYITDSSGTSQKYSKLSDYKFSKMKKEDWVTIKVNIPKTDNYNEFIVFDSNQWMVEAFVDDKLIYANCDELKEAVYHDGTECIPVSFDDSGVELVIKLTAAQKKLFLRIPQLYRMSSADGDTVYLQHNIIKLGGMVIFFVLGTIFVVFGMFKMKREKEMIGIAIIAFFCILCSIWMLMESSLGNVFIAEHKIMFILRYMCIMLCVVNAVAFFYYSGDYKSKTRTYLRKVLYALTTYVGIAFVAQLLNVVSIDKSCGVLLIATLLLSVYFLWLLIRVEHIKIDYRSESDFFILMLTPMLVVSVTGTVISKERNVMLGSPTSYILMALVIVYVVKVLKGSITQFLGSTQIASLEQLAYVDPLTGLANRNMCEKKFDEIDSISVGQFELIMFDVRGLKHVNDNFGHKSGDELIIVFSKALKNVFSEKGAFVGRMGGDEFVVIVNEEHMGEVNDMFFNLDKYLAHINGQNKYKFNIAYHHGVSICDRTRNHSIWKRYSLADKNMYDNDKK